MRKGRIYWAVKVLLTPTCWFRNYRTNKEWDELLRRQLERPCITLIDDYWCKLNGRTIWVENYPYACFTDGSINPCHGMPSRKTVFMLQEELLKARRKKEPSILPWDDEARSSH